MGVLFDEARVASHRTGVHCVLSLNLCSVSRDAQCSPEARQLENLLSRDRGMGLGPLRARGGGLPDTSAKFCHLDQVLQAKRCGLGV